MKDCGVTSSEQTGPKTTEGCDFTWTALPGKQLQVKFEFKIKLETLSATADLFVKNHVACTKIR